MKVGSCELLRLEREAVQESQGPDNANHKLIFYCLHDARRSVAGRLGEAGGGPTSGRS